MTKPDRTNIDALLRRAVESFNRLSPEQKKAHRRAQAISFVYGNLSLDNPLITREMVEKSFEDRG